MPTAKRLRFSVAIAAPPAKVWTTMLEQESYREWTRAFCEGSHYEGSWERGARILFLAPGGEGMVAEIAECRPHEHVSIRHLGVVANGVEDTTSDTVRAWAPAYENYTFEPVPEGTRLVVDQDVTAECEATMGEMWPKALERLRALCQGE